MPKYTPTDVQNAEREKRHVYHPPKGDQVERYPLIRAGGKGLAQIFDENCPMSRELALAHTHLEQAIFWANAAIARNE